MRDSVEFIILQFIFGTNVDICTFVLRAVAIFGRGKDYQEVSDAYFD